MDWSTTFQPPVALKRLVDDYFGYVVFKFFINRFVSLIEYNKLYMYMYIFTIYWPC